MRFRPIQSVFVAILAACALALAVGYAVAAVLEVSGSLPGDVQAALRTVKPVHTERGMNLIIVDGPPTGVDRGIQLGLLGFLLGGIPAAVLSTTLAARRRRLEQRGFARQWSEDWSTFFMGGLLFQLGSLALTAALLLAIFLSGSWDDLVWYGRFLLFSVLVDVLGAHAWHVFEREVRVAPTSIKVDTP